VLIGRRDNLPLMRDVLILLGLAITLLFNMGRALAICPCGDGVCNPSCIPPETPNSCPADCGPPPVDSIRVQNVALDAGLLIDGAESSNGAIVNDRGRVSTGSGDVTIEVGRLRSAAAPNRNEVIGFGKNRAPRRRATPWTIGGNDRFILALGGQIGLPLTVWIVQGPFASQRDHAFISALNTVVIWFNERMGTALSDLRIKDATNNPNIDDAILNSTGGDNRNWSDFSSKIGFDAGRINVYWINTVEGSTTTGWSDFSARIVMGKNTGDELLVHELGHALSLRHPENCGGSTAQFDSNNVMWPCSNSRQFLTEGQVFRSHFNATSSINVLYNARPGEPTVGCPDAAQSAECPALNRRLWPDGDFPAN
jgi:hypothetical protein